MPTATINPITMRDVDWTIDLTSVPAKEPVTLAEAKLHLNVAAAFTADNDLITAIISAARIYCENELDRAFITQTYKLYLDRYPNEIVLPRAPLQSVTSITYVDTDGATQTEATSVYQVDVTSEPGRIKPAWGKAWSAIRRQYKSIAVTFEAGYGDDITDVPLTTIAAIKLMVGQLYLFRETVVTGTIVAKLPFNLISVLKTESTGYEW